MDIGAGDIIEIGGSLVEIIFGNPSSTLLKLSIEPFLNPAVTILCVIGGIKIGWGFLSRAFR